MKIFQFEMHWKQTLSWLISLQGWSLGFSRHVQMAFIANGSKEEKKNLIRSWVTRFEPSHLRSLRHVVIDFLKCLYPSANLSKWNDTHIRDRAVSNNFRVQKRDETQENSISFASSFISLNCDHKHSCETWRNMLLAERLLLNDSHASFNPTINPIAPVAARQSPAAKLNNSLAVVYLLLGLHDPILIRAHSNLKLKKSFRSDC